MGSLMTAYGYARVSSDGQCLDAQREALAAAGAAKVFAEKLSGASAANRKELAKVLAKLEPGDVLLGRILIKESVFRRNVIQAP